MSDMEINLAISGMPMPVYFITTVDEKSGKCNIMTGCYLCQVSESPPMICLAVAPSRYTHELIEATGEFAINGVSQGGEWMEAINCCGTCSGRDVDKFERIQLETVSASQIKAPLIKDAYTHLECVVKEKCRAGDHSLFVAQVIAAQTNYQRPFIYYYGDVIPLK
jgi:flavin reductase (DIM6/NTAB) family NADH-FMN oxidoreductase RutF